MADIIRLEDRRSEIPPPPKGIVAAQILLFTGVRYERLEPPKRRTGTATKRSGKSTKRG